MFKRINRHDSDEDEDIDAWLNDTSKVHSESKKEKKCMSKYDHRHRHSAPVQIEETQEYPSDEKETDEWTNEQDLKHKKMETPKQKRTRKSITQMPLKLSIKREYEDDDDESKWLEELERELTEKERQERRKQRMQKKSITQMPLKPVRVIIIIIFSHYFELERHLCY